ncbi:MAG: ribose-phosphate diphosphokinase [Candidatus Nanopelagicales bacterium]|nr:ribose-phosphate diphosphokinase [Candidatus Nanopelagicales bacterium]MCH9678973.1 ribose-phosphate diphosphokinase [Actinomycetes bacterium]RZP28548.1 MAG: ribose-phosphate diphosphokinase [Acidimicrobiales bacterium]MBL6835039.1 ribose-phosphate diphosphokinase [Candidatus Nanopelagicales bacterium]MCH1463331.1 ribose-phosphate diphosphokinase [Candidatus Nanopelagicales bacterium]
MAEKSVPTQKRLVLLSGRSHPELAESVADELGIALSPTLAYDFANGEIFIRFRESVRGTDAFVLQSHTTPINTWIMEQLIMIDALKRASAKRITVIVPFYGYARQDKKHRGREPISARLMADLFKAAGADRLMTVDLHTSQIQGFFDGPVDHLFALPLLADHVASRVSTDQITVVSPDAGRVRVAERWTDVLGAPLAIIHKRRDPDVPNQVRVFEVVGDVKDRVCVVVDDMIDTGGTIVKAAETLFENGAKDVIVAATHGILSDPACDRLQQSQISEVVVTDTLPIPQARQFDKLTVLSIAPLLGTAINEVFTDGSVTSMFEAATADEASSH